MLRLVVLSVVVVACLANPSYRDCAPGGSSVKIKKLEVEPHPVRVPGEVTFRIEAEVTRPFSNFDLNVTLEKEINGARIVVPCLNNLGTCYYRNACPFLDLLFPDKQCPPLMSQCTCPFSEHKLSVKGLTLTIPTVPPEINDLLTGRFHLKLALHDSDTRKIFSCLDLSLVLKAGYLYFL